MWKDNSTNIKDNLPEYYHGVPEVDAKVNSSNEAIQEFKNSVKGLSNNIFVETADETGVERYEKIWSMKPLDTDILEDRKRKLLARFLDKPPINDNTVMNIVSQYLGVPVGIYRFKDKPYYMEFRYRNADPLINAKPLEEVLRNLIPANIAFKITYSYVTWGEIKPHTIGQVKTRTWGQVLVEG